MNRIKWGIVGCGRIAHTFARDIAHVSQASLVAVAARDLDRSRAFAAEYAVGRAHGSYDALFNDRDVDAVYIATPHSAHLDQCSAALTAGKAVLCEKPLTLDPQQCAELQATAQHCGVYLMEGMWTWFLPAIRQALDWVRGGRIGELQQVKADFGYPLPYSPTLREYDAALGGGAVLEMGIYPVALARLFLDAAPQRIQASGHLAANGVEDQVSAIIDFPTGTATLGTSFRAKLRNWAYIIGSDGYIAIPDFWRATGCYLYQLDQRVDSFEAARSSEGFDYQIAAASDDILAGRLESSVVPLSSSLAFQQDMKGIISLVRDLT